MNTNKKTAVVVGMLFLIAMVSSLVGGGMIEPALNNPGGLQNLPAHQTQLVSGVLLELVNAIAVVGIAVLLFPILRKYSEVLALGYVSFRIIEVVMQVISDVIPLSLMTASQEYLANGVPEAASFQTNGAVWIAARAQLMSTMLGLFFSLGAFVLYVVLFQTRLVPRWLSVWGFIGAVLILSLNMMGTFGISFNAGMILALPIILNEIVLGIWLIVKGFNSSPNTFEPSQQLQTSLT